MINGKARNAISSGNNYSSLRFHILCPNHLLLFVSQGHPIPVQESSQQNRVMRMRSQCPFYRPVNEHTQVTNSSTRHKNKIFEHVLTDNYPIANELIYHYINTNEESCLGLYTHTSHITIAVHGKCSFQKVPQAAKGQGMHIQDIGYHPSNINRCDCDQKEYTNSVLVVLVVLLLFILLVLMSFLRWNTKNIHSDIMKDPRETYKN